MQAKQVLSSFNPNLQSRTEPRAGFELVIRTTYWIYHCSIPWQPLICIDKVLLRGLRSAGLPLKRIAGTPQLRNDFDIPVEGDGVFSVQEFCWVDQGGSVIG
jgi:hypothetical protein